MGRIAFFGGSFNPVHRGHLLVARRVVRCLGFDRLHFLPARCPPHKTERDMLPAELRVELLELATRRQPHFVVDRFELEHPEFRYTYDTLCALEQVHPTARPLAFVIGGDSLRDLPKWYRSRELVKRFDFITVPRDPGIDRETLLAGAIAAFDAPDVDRLRANFLNVPPFPISSTEIRAGLDARTAAKVLPRAVRLRLAQLR